MRTSSHLSLTSRTRRLSRRGEQGMAVIVVIALLALIFLYVSANIRTLHHLSRDIKLIEQRQTHRLASTTLKTNSVPQSEVRAPKPEMPSDQGSPK